MAGLPDPRGGIELERYGVWPPRFEGGGFVVRLPVSEVDEPAGDERRGAVGPHVTQFRRQERDRSG
jgi:hypothetical protein